MAEQRLKTEETKTQAEEKAVKTAKNPDKFAVIKTGGKQYVVTEGVYYDFEKIEAEEGKEVTFEEVLLVSEGGNIKLGAPVVSGVKVTGKVLSQFKDDKVTVFKYKPKKRYRKTYGHRQHKSRVQITKIS